MKKVLLLGQLLFGQLVLGQTAKAIQVAGTKCSIIPPDGFVASTTFSGFQDTESGVSIMVTEMPAPYKSIVDGFSTTALKSRGMTLISKETIDFNNSTATLVHLKQPASGTTYLKQILIFGDENTTVIVNGIYPESAKSLEVEIKASLLSTVYSINQSDNPLEAATFTIDLSDTEFEFVAYISGSMIYASGGKIPTEKPVFIVGNSISKISTQDRKKYAEERLKKLPRGDQNVLKAINDIAIDNLNGYEIIAEGVTKDDLPQLVYQVMLFDENGDYYIIIGLTKDDFEKYVAIYRRISQTFKRK